MLWITSSHSGSNQSHRMTPFHQRVGPVQSLVLGQVNVEAVLTLVASLTSSSSSSKGDLACACTTRTTIHHVSLGLLKTTTPLDACYGDVHELFFFRCLLDDLQRYRPPHPHRARSCRYGTGPCGYRAPSIFLSDLSRSRVLAENGVRKLV